MGASYTRHRLVPLNPEFEQRTRPTFDKEREAEILQREADTAFVKKLALAIWRGDHIPKGQKKPKRPLVLT